MKYRYLIIFLILVSTISCAGQMQVRHETVEPSGKPFPVPHYVLQTIDPNQPIRVTFFYRGIQNIKDLDGRNVPQESYLDRRHSHDFKSKDTVQLVVRVLNPRNLKYKVFCRQSIYFTEGGHYEYYGDIALSDMIYREYEKELPIDEHIRKAIYELQVTDENGSLLLTTGKFKYNVN